MDAKQDHMLAIMATIQRRLDDKLDSDRERQFFSHSLMYMSQTRGMQLEMQSWTVTRHEVDFERIIGSGGLSVVARCVSCVLFA